MFIEQLIAGQQENKYLYLIESKIKPGYLLIDYGFDAETSLELFLGKTPVGRSDSAAIWFPDRRLALKFDTEESVEEFRTFLDRPSSIIRIGVEEILRRL